MHDDRPGCQTNAKRKHDRKRAFDRRNLPGYQPTPTLLEKGVVRGCAPIVSAGGEGGLCHGRDIESVAPDRQRLPPNLC